MGSSIFSELATTLTLRFFCSRFATTEGRGVCRRWLLDEASGLVQDSTNLLEEDGVDS